MEKVKLGLIGLGYIGKIHLRNSLGLVNTKLAAVSDISKKALKQAQEAGAKKTFTDYEQLLNDPRIDAVVIALPTHLHLECAKRAAEAKKHILLEKPIARNVAEAKEIISTSQRNSVKLMIGYPLRFNDTMCRLGKKIKSGELGEVVTAYATNVGSGPFQHRTHDFAPAPVPEWWFKKELSGGGVLMDLGSHMINLLRGYFGEITDIKSYFGHRFNMDLEDHAICLTQFEAGPTAIINVGWFSQKYQVKVELLGTVQHAVADNVPPNRISAAVQMLTMRTSTFWRPYLNELKYFINCVINDVPPSSSGKDGLKDLEAIESAYKNSIQLNSCMENS